MTDNATVMSPEHSPEQLSKKRSGIRRVNNVPLYLIGTALGIFILIMALVAMDRARKQHQQTEATAEYAGGDSQMFANQVTSGHASGMVPATRSLTLTPPARASSQRPPPVQVIHPDLELPPMPPGDGQSDKQRDQIQQAKFAQFMSAIRARTAVTAQGFRSPGSVPGGPPSETLTGADLQARLQAASQQLANIRSIDPTTAYARQLAMIKKDLAADEAAPALAGQGSNGAIAGDDETASNSSGNAGSEMPAPGAEQAKVGGDRWALKQAVENPTSPYELRAGSVMPATLISGINSELPGMIMAQVSQHIFDTPTGHNLLIPQCSRLVGTYTSNVAYGQSRVLVAWQRIVFPDGKALDLGAMPGADGAGYAGYADKVNHHYLRLFGSALLMSAITAGIAYSQDRNQQTNAFGYAVPTASQEMSQALGQQLGMATANMIQKNLNISPTIEIRPGFRFNVIVTKDIALTKPYRSFDY